MPQAQSCPWPLRLLAQGQTHCRGGHQPVPLDDPGRAWLVDAGQVELFLVSRQAEGGDGPRHYLATVGAGGLLLGIPTAAPTDFLLLAVPHADTRLIDWPLALLVHEAAAPGAAEDLIPALALALERWLRALSAGMAGWVRPRPAVGFGIAPGETLSIPAGRRCAGRHALAWVRLGADQGAFLDLQGLPPAAGDLTFPLAPEAWLLIGGGLELAARSTAQALADGAAWDGVAVLHRLLFETASLNLRLANVDEYNRLRERRAANEADRDQAFRALMGVTDRHQRGLFTPTRGDTPLVAALRLIGRESGFAVRLPTDLKPGDAPTLAGLVRASGLRQREVVLRDDWWRYDFGVLLAFDRETGQPRVLLSAGRPRVVDPATGAEEPLAGARASLVRFAPANVWEFTAPLPFRALGLREFFGLTLARGGRDALPMLLMGAVLGLIGLATPVATAYLIDSVIPNHEVAHLIEIGLVLAVLGGTAMTVRYVSTLAFTRLESRVGVALQSGVVDRVLRLPMGFFQGYSTGDLATRLMAVDRIQQLVSTASVNALLGGLFGLFGFVLMFHYDPRLAGWAGLLTLVYLGLSLLLSDRRLREERPQAQLAGRLNNTLLQTILGVAKIRLAAAEDRAFARLAGLFAQDRRHQLAAQRIGAAQAALNQVLTLAGLLLFVVLIGKPSGQPDLLAIGAFSALLVAFQYFAASLSLMIHVGTGLVAVQPQLERLRPLLLAVPEIGEDRADPGALSGAIEVSHLSFRYAPDAPLVLDDCSLEAAAGDFVALVGPSGSGKSTLLRLLLGFESPESGGILFDGKDLAGLDATAVRRQMGVVMQNAQLMPRSLFDNIVGTSGGSLDDAWEAATQVGLADDIRAMPMGMQTVVLEGGGALSGGQMQRLMIARAIVGRPRMLLLDEATSALDNRTQAVVTESLDRLRVTRIVVAHRLSTVANADRIHVLEAGRIVETGTYGELMAANGAFARLAERQLA